MYKMMTVMKNRRKENVMMQFSLCYSQTLSSLILARNQNVFRDVLFGKIMFKVCVIQKNLNRISQDVKKCI